MERSGMDVLVSGSAMKSLVPEATASNGYVQLTIMFMPEAVISNRVRTVMNKSSLRHQASIVMGQGSLGMLKSRKYRNREITC